MKNNVVKIEKVIKSKQKCLAMLAPSFVTDFKYPSIITQLRQFGIDKVVELTFGAKMINRDYHKKLKNTKKILISSTCPGVVSYIENNHPELIGNMMPIDSPMVAMAKICKKYFPDYKIIFISPCSMKKLEAEKTKYVDYVIDYQQLKLLFEKNNIKESNAEAQFDKFYNDYTKIYPLSGALYKTAHIDGILKSNQVTVIDGIKDVSKFLEKPNKKVLFLDCLFCEGGCIGGPHTNKELKIRDKKHLVKKYLKKAKKEDIKDCRKGVIKKANGIKFSKD